jgi:hypothetical protein
MTLIRNRGTAGDVLNGTNTGLVKVEGPAVWLPGVASNDIRFVSTGAEVPAGDFTVEIGLNPSTIPFGAGTSSQEIYGATNPAYGWALRIDSSGLLFLTYRNAADTLWLAPKATDPMLTTDRWVRAVVDSTGLSIEFFASENRNAWRALGPAVAMDEPVVNPVASGVTVTLTSNNNGNLFVVQPYLGARVTVAGSPVFDLSPADIAATDPAATTIVTTVGPDVSITRTATGPVTTLVPAGKTVLINPETGGSAVRIDWAAAGYQPLAGNDLVHGYLFNRGNVPGGQTNVFAGGGFNPYFGSGNPPSSFVVSVLGITQGAGSGLMQLTADPFEPCVVFVVLNHDTNILTGYCYDKTGEVGNTGGRAFTGEAAVNGGFFMRSVPGSFGCGFYREGAGIAAEYDDTTLAALASYLLTEDI